MTCTRVTCYFPVEHVPESKFGAFKVWYVDVDIDERDNKMDVRKAIALATGAPFSKLKIRLGGCGEVLAFVAGAYGDRLRVGNWGASKAVFEPRLLRAHELNDLGAGSVTDLPDWDHSKYDGRYDWVQEVRDEWK